MNLFTEKDKGCWIDGTFGEAHAIRKAKSILKSNGREITWAGVPGDEFLDNFTECLQENTAPGLTWIWEAGDLILMDEVEAE